MKNWITPVAHIQLKTDGYIITNYDTAMSLTDSSCIKLPILSFIDKELLVLKVNLNGNFAQSVRNEDGQLQEIINLKKQEKIKQKLFLQLQDEEQAMIGTRPVIFLQKATSGLIWNY